MDWLTELLTGYGLEIPITAIATVVLTGILKMPVKYLANKTAASKKITRYITFLPIVVGFGLTALITYVIKGEVVFEHSFFTQWLSTASLSLAIYAFLEKFAPSERKILTDAEIKANQAVVEELKERLTQQTPEESVKETKQANENKKFILTNGKNK